MRLMTDIPKVTIIIPVHNSEKYLRECIQSALSQTLEDIEILCIDGGSTDFSRCIIDELQKNDERVVYMSDKNTGYGHKLNVGIGTARGKYIAVLESDDRMYPDMLKTLYDKAADFGADIVDADYDAVFSRNGRVYRNTIHKYARDESYDRLIDYTGCGNMDREIPSCGIWTGIYKKEFLIKRSIRLNESKGASFQDTSFLFMTGLLAKSVYHVRKPLYQYRIDNMGSSVKDDSKLYEIVGECEFLRKELIRHGIQEEKKWGLYYIRKYNCFCWNYRRLSPDSRKEFLERYLEALISDVQKGAVNRELFAGQLYDYTFLLIDDKDKFADMISQNDRRTWAAEFNELLDMIENREVVVFGAGILGKNIIRLMNYNNIVIQAICDNAVHLHGAMECGISIMSVKRAVEKYYDAVYIIANKKDADKMKTQLIDMGIRETDIAIYR